MSDDKSATEAATAEGRGRRKIRTGLVTSDKMERTVTVSVVPGMTPTLLVGDDAVSEPPVSG